MNSESGIAHVVFTPYTPIGIHAPSSRHLRALLNVCGGCSFGGLGCCSCRVCVCRWCCSLSVCVCVTCFSYYTLPPPLSHPYPESCCGFPGACALACRDRSFTPRIPRIHTPYPCRYQVLDERKIQNPPYPHPIPPTAISIHTLYLHRYRYAHPMPPPLSVFTPYTPTGISIHTLYPHRYRYAHPMPPPISVFTPYAPIGINIHTVYPHRYQYSHRILPPVSGA